MNNPVMQPLNDVPTCFAKDWDKNAPECAGGPDPSFVHPVTQLHIREQCSFFNQCGARTQAARQAQVIRPETLVRPSPGWQPPPSPQTAPVGPPQTFADYLRQQHAHNVEAQRQAALSGIRPPQQAVFTAPSPQPQPHPMMHPGPWGQVQYPASRYELNYTMPAYLSVAEERLPGEGLTRVLLREVLRSVLKAIGHAFAHFFDSRTIRAK
jgi:hypothetical protein